MAYELELIPNPSNIPQTIQNSYQRQNEILKNLMLGIDTTAPRKIDDNTIFFPAGGLVESNGNLYKITNDVSLNVSGYNDCFFAILTTGLGTSMSITATYPTFIPSQNGFYTANSQRVLNTFYMRKILVRKNESGENLDPITFIDLSGSGSTTLSFPYGTKYRFEDDTEEKTTTGVISKTRPNKGYVRFNSGLSTL